MNVSHSCNGINIFIRWKMKCTIQLGFASMNGTFHVSPQENICTIELINIHYLYICHFIFYVRQDWKMRAVFSFRYFWFSVYRKVCAPLQKLRRSWNAGMHVEVPLDVASILEVGSSLHTVGLPSLIKKSAIPLDGYCTIFWFATLNKWYKFLNYNFWGRQTNKQKTCLTWKWSLHYRSRSILQFHPEISICISRFNMKKHFINTLLK